MPRLGLGLGPRSILRVSAVTLLVASIALFSFRSPVHEGRGMPQVRIHIHIHIHIHSHSHIHIHIHCHIHIHNHNQTLVTLADK